MKNGILRDKVMAMSLLSTIGNALGMSVDDLTKKEIEERFRFVREYLPARPDHKWCKGFLKGQWTDDTQLFLAIARAYISTKSIDIVEIYLEHIKEMERNTAGWGDSTIDSLKQIHAIFPGDEFTKCNISDFGNPTGAGNGVAMKIAPIGAVMSANYLKLKDILSADNFASDWQEREKYIHDCIAEIAMMTHRTRMAIASGFAQVNAIHTCLLSNGEDVKRFRKHFSSEVIRAVKIGESYQLKDALVDKLSKRYHNLLQNTVYIGNDIDKLLALTDGATCYVYNSLPFSHAMFMRNPTSIETLFDVINAGGDTDSNGAIVGALLGAYNGTKIIPRYLLDGLWRREEVEDTARRFCDALDL